MSVGWSYPWRRISELVSLWGRSATSWRSLRRRVESKVRIRETGDGLVVTALLLGVKREDVEDSFLEGTLRISRRLQ